MGLLHSVHTRSANLKPPALGTAHAASMHPAAPSSLGLPLPLAGKWWCCPSNQGQVACLWPLFKNSSSALQIRRRTIAIAEEHQRPPGEPSCEMGDMPPSSRAPCFPENYLIVCMHPFGDRRYFLSDRDALHSTLLWSANCMLNCTLQSPIVLKHHTTTFIVTTNPRWRLFRQRNALPRLVLRWPCALPLLGPSRLPRIMPKTLSSLSSKTRRLPPRHL